MINTHRMKYIPPGTNVDAIMLNNVRDLHDVELVHVSELEVVVDDGEFRVFTPVMSVASLVVLKKDLFEDED